MADSVDFAARSHCRGGIPLGNAVAALMALFTIDTVLLLAFLGRSFVMTAALAAIAAIVIGRLTARAISAHMRIAVPTIFACIAIAAALLLLGGEGRLFFATADWQIRDVVLADMGRNPWPFAYWLDGQAKTLRAPLGMYLVPALVGGANQTARDWMLFSHNLAILTLILGIASTLFEGARQRLIAVGIFVVFSGWDVIGTLLIHKTFGHAHWGHLETWAGKYQYSSHITQLFWVPQHAFAGWACALTFALWRREFASVGLFAATLPLVAIWSPLALLGAVPFAVFAGVQVLLTGRWRGQDVLLAAAAAGIALPALAYLGADAQKLGGHAQWPHPVLYALIILLEVAPLVLPSLLNRSASLDRPTLLIATGCLLLMPLWQLGAGSDFQMRASIMPLAVAALAFAQWAVITRTLIGRLAVILILAVGSVTGAAELWRSVRYLPSPVPHCTLDEAWTQQSGLIVPNDSYFAATAALPAWLRPDGQQSRANVGPLRRCWSRRWMTPRSTV